MSGELIVGLSPGVARAPWPADVAGDRGVLPGGAGPGSPSIREFPSGSIGRAARIPARRGRGRSRRAAGGRRPPAARPPAQPGQPRREVGCGRTAGRPGLVSAGSSGSSTAHWASARSKRAPAGFLCMGGLRHWWSSWSTTSPAGDLTHTYAATRHRDQSGAGHVIRW